MATITNGNQTPKTIKHTTNNMPLHLQMSWGEATEFANKSGALPGLAGKHRTAVSTISRILHGSRGLKERWPNWTRKQLKISASIDKALNKYQTEQQKTDAA